MCLLFIWSLGGDFIFVSQLSLSFILGVPVCTSTSVAAPDWDTNTSTRLKQQGVQHTFDPHIHTLATQTLLFDSVCFLELSTGKSQSQSLHHHLCVCVCVKWCLFHVATPPCGFYPGKRNCMYLLVAANPVLKKNGSNLVRRAATVHWFSAISRSSCISTVTNITSRKVSSAFQWFRTLILWCIICKDCCRLLFFFCQLVFGVVQFVYWTEQKWTHLLSSYSVCMVGPNGVGKSTLLLLLTGKINPVSSNMQLLQLYMDANVYSQIYPSW